MSAPKRPQGAEDKTRRPRVGRKYRRVTFDVTDLDQSDGVSEGQDWDGADLAGVNPIDWGDEPP